MSWPIDHSVCGRRGAVSAATSFSVTMRRWRAMAKHTYGLPTPQFSVGDSVLRKNTGQGMLVDDVKIIAGLYRYRCMWMDTEGVIQFQDFREDELDRTES
jgi:uncharacterized protein YodC (DUF2158 family)